MLMIVDAFTLMNRLLLTKSASCFQICRLKLYQEDHFFQFVKYRTQEILNYILSI